MYTNTKKTDDPRNAVNRHYGLPTVAEMVLREGVQTRVFKTTRKDN